MRTIHDVEAKAEHNGFTYVVYARVVLNDDDIANFKVHLAKCLTYSTIEDVSAARIGSDVELMRKLKADAHKRALAQRNSEEWAFDMPHF